jgi:ABC-type nitrate/sulfonate/bicarbonate transport system permease component
VRLLAALLVLWEVLGRLLLDPRSSMFVPLPSTVVVTTFELARSGELFGDTARSAARVLVGAGLGALAGVGAGAAIASERFGKAIEAPLALLRPVPPVAWIPITLLWFGVGEAQQIAILFGAAFHVVAAGAADAVRRVPRPLLLAAANLGAGEAAIARVRTRAALPGVLAAVREGFGTGWFVLVAAEFVSASEGLGVLVLEGRDMLAPARTFVGMAALAACGALTDAALRRAQARVTAWA